MEKNMAPKWMEGRYVLDIEGNKVTITDGKTLYSYTARCHPDDKFAIEDAIAEVFQKKYDDEMKIKVGDTVKVICPLTYDLYADWVDKNVTNSMDKCRFAFNGGRAPQNVECIVKYIAKHSNDCDDLLAYIQPVHGIAKCYLVNLDSLEKVKA